MSDSKRTTNTQQFKMNGNVGDGGAAMSEVIKVRNNTVKKNFTMPDSGKQMLDKYTSTMGKVQKGFGMLSGGIEAKNTWQNSQVEDPVLRGISAGFAGFISMKMNPYKLFADNAIGYVGNKMFDTTQTPSQLFTKKFDEGMHTFEQKTKNMQLKLPDIDDDPFF